MFCFHLQLENNSIKIIFNSILGEIGRKNVKKNTKSIPCLLEKQTQMS